MNRYRICRNAAPHRQDWWIVEREERGRIRFWRTFWRPVQTGTITPAGPAFWTREFGSEAEAQAWVDEAKRPRLHECGEPQ